MTVLFVVGAPGAGKTSMVRHLLGMQGPELPMGGYLVPKPKWTVTGTACAAGHYTGGVFDGADTVPYNGALAALDYWHVKLRDLPLTVLDGDRFSNQSTLTYLDDLGLKSRLAVISVEAADAVLAERRAARGSAQNPTWMLGRGTKARNFLKLLQDNGARALRLDAALATPEALAEQVRAWL